MQQCTMPATAQHRNHRHRCLKRSNSLRIGAWAHLARVAQSEVPHLRLRPGRQAAGGRPPKTRMSSSLFAQLQQLMEA